MVKCRDCGNKCRLLISKTPRNPGRKFWSCPKGCKTWNGWAAADYSSDSDSSDSDSSSSEELERARKKTSAAKDYRCAKCDKVLDLGHEVSNHIRRFSETMPYAAAMRGEFMREINEAAASGEYTCEKCLHNE
jgi:hypothetical protein